MVTPAVSSSVTVAVTLPMMMPLYLPSVEVALWLMVTLRASPVLSTSSFTPVTVTVWTVFQLLVVKVNVAELTVAAAVLPEVTAISTLAVGWLFNRSV